MKKRQKLKSRSKYRTKSTILIHWTNNYCSLSNICLSLPLSFFSLFLSRAQKIIFFRSADFDTLCTNNSHSRRIFINQFRSLLSSYVNVFILFSRCDYYITKGLLFIYVAYVLSRMLRSCNVDSLINESNGASYKKREHAIFRFRSFAVFLDKARRMSSRSAYCYSHALPFARFTPRFSSFQLL